MANVEKNKINNKENVVFLKPEDLNKSPEELEKEMIKKLSNEAMAKGKTISEKIGDLEEKYPQNAHSAELADLENELRSTLSEVVEKIAPIKKPAAITPEQKAKGERLELLAKITKSLQPIDANLKQSLGTIKPDNITKAQEDSLTLAEKALNAEFTKNNLTDSEKTEIIKFLPNFIKAKVAMINFKIEQNKKSIAMIERNKLNLSTRAIKRVGGGTQFTDLDKIAAKKEEIANLQNQLNNFGKAA